ncbi:MAG TPA: hypothetical protein VE220_08200 [Gaiellaceae bacterium]|nr:hypothetical protein [Gaiellaceae bacterium]
MRACCAVLGVHLAFVAAFCAFAVDGLYIALVAQQGNGMGGRVGAASIGILVAPAAIFAMTALSRLRAPSFVVAAGVALAVLTAAAGLAWTQA